MSERLHTAVAETHWRDTPTWSVRVGEAAGGTGVKRPSMTTHTSGVRREDLAANAAAAKSAIEQKRT